MASRILIVEDQPIEREALGTLLRAEGYAVDLAADGKQALMYLRDVPNAPDVILLDMLMPVMDGWHFLQEIVKLGLTPKPYIIVTTGSGAIGREWVTSHGADGVIPKPIQLEALLAEIREFLVGHRHA